MKHWFYRVVLVGLGLHWIAIFVGTHLPPRNLPDLRVSDKIEHLAAFTVLTVLLNTALKSKCPRSGDWLTILIILVYAAVDEKTQPYMGRTCDFQDWLADGAGASLGVCLCGLARAAVGMIARKPIAEASPIGYERVSSLP